MRFRITHLLMAMVVLAGLSFAVSMFPSESVPYIKLGACIVFSLMAIRAIARPGLERVVLASALVLGLPYFCWTLTLDEFNGPRYVTSELMYKVFDWFANSFATPDDFKYYRWIGVQIGHVVLSFILACIGGLLGAYWYRTADEKSKI